MKILMIGWGFPPRIQGGLDVHVFEISKELSKNNRVYLTLPQFNSPHESLGRRLDAIGSSRHSGSGINIIPIKCPKFADIKSLVNSVNVYSANIVKVCKRLDFDVVHSHDWFGVQAAEGLGKPWVFSLHSLEYMRSGSSRKSEMESLEGKGVKNAGRVITVSRLMKDDILRRYGIASGKIDVVYNSASTGKGYPQVIRKRFRLGRKPVALFLGRLSGQKGPEYFLHAAKLVLEEIPDARFIVAGEGNLSRSLQQFSHHLGLDGSVIFTGFVPEKELTSYYSAADAYILPSLHEPFGITVLESLLAGTPAVVSENAGVLENIPQMCCIHKVRPADSHELAEGIIGLLKNPQRVSESEKSMLRKAYSWEKSAEQILQVYQKVI